MKKLVSLFLALAMVLSMASFAAAEEPFVITVMLPDHNVDVDFQAENNPILEAIEKATGVKLNWKYGPRREGDIEKIWGDCTKANEVLGWKAEAKLEDVLASAWKWQQKLRADGIM